MEINSIEDYNSYHKLCPICFSSSCETTLAGYIVNDIKTYVDKNICTCMDCGDTHIVHDRVPYNEISLNQSKYKLSFIEAMNILMNGGFVKGENFAKYHFLSIDNNQVVNLSDVNNYYKQFPVLLTTGLINQKYRQLTVATLKETEF